METPRYFCGKCDTEIQSGVRKCSKCGNNIVRGFPPFVSAVLLVCGGIGGLVLIGTWVESKKWQGIILLLPILFAAVWYYFIRGNQRKAHIRTHLGDIVKDITVPPDDWQNAYSDDMRDRIVRYLKEGVQ